MHLSTWLRMADLGDGELKPEDRQELLQAATIVKQLLFARPVSPEDAAREMARVCGLKGAEVERWRQEQDELLVTMAIGFRRCAPDVITLSDGSEHKVEHEKISAMQERLAKLFGVKRRTIKDWCRKWLS